LQPATQTDAVSVQEDLVSAAHAVRSLFGQIATFSQGKVQAPQMQLSMPQSASCSQRWSQWVLLSVPP
jgi:hypothetical protein